MPKLRTVAMIAALLLAGSSFALAQTSSPSSSSTPAATPPTTPVPGPQPSEMSNPSAQQAITKGEQEARTKLENAGYSDVTDIKQDTKNGYTASALKNGKRVKVDIDANGKMETLN